MPERRRRSVFETGHRRKFLVVVDETPEVESALVYAANRAKRTGGMIKLLYVITQDDMSNEWLGVREAYLEEQQNKAKAVFRLAARKLKAQGVDEAAIEDSLREGNKSEQILKLIEEDQDIAVLVLGASTDPAGPGPLVSSLATGKLAGNFPIPITIVPGTLSAEEIEGLA
ncbi:MAG: universal stress protein [Hyphomicrobiaceae bacterium]